MTELPLFVYGTLRRGECNHDFLDGSYHQMLAARLRDFARADPLMIVKRVGGMVDGELYFLRADVYDQTLRRCDRLEDIPPGKMAGAYYRRIQVVVETSEGDFAAWAYVHPHTPLG